MPSSTPRAGHFQDVLAASAREGAAERKARADHELKTGGDGATSSRDAMPPAMMNMDRQQGAAEQGGIIDECVDCFMTCGGVYIIVQTSLNRCFNCVRTCGGLLEISDAELRSWGVRDGQQPARFRGACGQPCANQGSGAAPQATPLASARATAAEAAGLPSIRGATSHAASSPSGSWPEIGGK